MQLPGINKDPKEVTCAVAMSGGVDSSTVAGLLHEAGYKVIGITMQLYNNTHFSSKKKGSCCAGKDIHDAKQVADKLGIAHYVLNYEDKFKKAVIDDFVDSYISGSTPIPCVRCNQSVKFTDLLNLAKSLKVDFLATGHYVKKIIGSHGPELHKGEDPKKDQSYFLFATTKEQLDFLQFPISQMNKQTTREHAKRLGLNVHDKPDSQDICFVEGSYSDVVKKQRPESSKKGKIMHIDGYELGEHEGVINYTIGQRKKIGVSFAHALYVVKIDAKNNILYVGGEEKLYSSRCQIKEVNFLCSLDEISCMTNIEAKIRYKSASVKVKFEHLQGKYYVNLQEKQKSIAKGQACVLYSGNRVLGGGWIS